MSLMSRSDVRWGSCRPTTVYNACGLVNDVTADDSNDYLTGMDLKCRSRRQIESVSR